MRLSWCYILVTLFVNVTIDIGGWFCSKTCLTLAISRIKLLQNKRDAQLKLMRKEIAQFLQAGQEAIARIRVEILGYLYLLIIPFTYSSNWYSSDSGWAYHTWAKCMGCLWDFGVVLRVRLCSRAYTRKPKVSYLWLEFAFLKAMKFHYLLGLRLCVLMTLFSQLRLGDVLYWQMWFMFVALCLPETSLSTFLLAFSFSPLNNLPILSLK